MATKRISKLMTVSLPPSLYEQAIKTANKEGRTNSELIRECLRRYVSDKNWRKLLRYGRRKALQTGLKPEDIEDIVDEIRSRLLR